MADPNDPVVWNPAINSAGTYASNQRYDFTGSTKIDQTVDTGDPTPILRGATGGGATYINQIITQIRTRITALNTALGTARPLPALISTSLAVFTKIDIQDHILDLRSDIDFIRTNEGIYPPYVWTTDFDTLGVNTEITIKGYHYAEMRKALAGRFTKRTNTETLTLPVMTVLNRSWPKNPPGLLLARLRVQDDGSTPGVLLGQIETGTSGVLERRTTYYFKFNMGVAPIDHTTATHGYNPYTSSGSTDYDFNNVQVAGLTQNDSIYFGTTGGTTTPPFATAGDRLTYYFDPLSLYGSLASASSSGDLNLNGTLTTIANRTYFLHYRRNSPANLVRAYNDPSITSIIRY